LFSIDASAEDGRFGRLINHSKRHPNLKPKVCAVDGSPRLFFTARRNIVAGEELLYDYGKQEAEVLRCTLGLSTDSLAVSRRLASFVFLRRVLL